MEPGGLFLWMATGAACGASAFAAAVVMVGRTDLIERAAAYGTACGGMGGLAAWLGSL